MLQWSPKVFLLFLRVYTCKSEDAENSVIKVALCHGCCSFLLSWLNKGGQVPSDSGLHLWKQRKERVNNSSQSIVSGSICLSHPINIDTHYCWRWVHILHRNCCWEASKGKFLQAELCEIACSDYMWMFCACLFTNQCPQINLVRVAMNGWKHPWCTLCGPDSLTFFSSPEICVMFLVCLQRACVSCQKLLVADPSWGSGLFGLTWGHEAQTRMEVG